MQKVSNQSRSIILFILFLLAGESKAHGSTVYISVAASMTDAFREVTTAFSKVHPDIRLLANYASSGSLAKQIAQGAPADLFISANPRWMDYLIEQGAVDISSKRTFAFNKLVFIGGADQTVTDLSALTSLGKIAIGSPQNVPAGQYAREAMEEIGIYTTLSSEKKLVMAKDARQALIYADNGIVDGAFVYRTDALLAKNVSVLFTVPDVLYSRISYPLALTSNGREKPEAVLLLEFMAKPEALQILEKYGFEGAGG